MTSAPMVGQQGCRPMTPIQGFQRAGIKEEIKRITLIKRLLYIGQGAGHFLNIFSFNVHSTSFPRSGSLGSGRLSNLPRDEEVNLNPTLPSLPPCLGLLPSKSKWGEATGLSLDYKPLEVRQNDDDDDKKKTIQSLVEAAY